MEVSGRRAQGSEEAYNICDNCMRKHSIERAAFGYCIDCYDYFCQECYQTHCDPRPSRNHKLLDGKQMPKERLRPVDICHTHPDERLRYFCKVHSVLACQTCAFMKHRLCNDICEISTLSSDPKNDQRYKEITQKIASLKLRNDKNHEIRQQNVFKIDTNKKQARADIKHFCKTMHDHLYKIEHSLDDEIDQIGLEDSKHMDEIQQESDSVSGDLKVMTSELQTNKDPDRKNQLFIAMTKAESTIEKLDTKLTTLSNDNTVRQYTFKPDDRLKGILADVNKIGTMTIHGDEKAVLSPPTKAQIKPQWTLDTVTIEPDGGINVQAQSEQRACRITGSTMMKGDTTLAITDWNNNSVKLVDVRRKEVISRMQLPDPWDVTQVLPDQLAITLSETKKIQFVSVTGTSMSLGREMKVSGNCRGIAHANDRLFVSFDRPPQVQVLDMSGSVLNTFKTQPDGQNQFARPYHLSLSADQSQIYVSDHSNSAVYRLDMNGRVKATCKNKALQGPYGLCSAEDGSMIVCGDESNNLYMISADCTRGRVLADKSRGVNSPDSVTYSKALSKLYVGQCDSNTLMVFKLK